MMKIVFSECCFKTGVWFFVTIPVNKQKLVGCKIALIYLAAAVYNFECLFFIHGTFKKGSNIAAALFASFYGWFFRCPPTHRPLHPVYRSGFFVASQLSGPKSSISVGFLRCQPTWQTWLPCEYSITSLDSLSETLHKLLTNILHIQELQSIPPSD